MAPRSGLKSHLVSRCLMYVHYTFAQDAMTVYSILSDDISLVSVVVTRFE